MKIYRIIPDRCPQLVVQEETLADKNLLRFDCSERRAAWQPLKVRVPDLSLPRGRFFSLAPGCIAMDKDAAGHLKDLLEPSGELLPLECEGAEYILLNVTPCSNVLDQQRTRWKLQEKTGKRLWISAYAFESDQIPKAPIFKIPETKQREMLVWEDSGDPATEFKARVEQLGLVGLRFEELWSENRDTLIETTSYELQNFTVWVHGALGEHALLNEVAQKAAGERMLAMKSEGTPLEESMTHPAQPQDLQARPFEVGQIKAEDDREIAVAPEISPTLTRHGLGRLAGVVVSEVKDSVELVPVDDDASDNPVTRLGGRPNLPANIEWPRANETPLAFIAQLDLGHISAMKDMNLPARGALFFFYEGGDQTWGFRFEDRGSFRVIYTGDALQDQPVRPFPEGLANDLQFRGVHVTAEHVSTSIPDASDQVLAASALSRDERRAYCDFYAEVLRDPGRIIHRIGGYPDCIQSDPKLEAQLASHGLYCGDLSGYTAGKELGLYPGARDWKLLLQVDSEPKAKMMWGDGGRLYFMIKNRDLEEHRFENVWMVLQCS